MKTAIKNAHMPGGLLTGFGIVQFFSSTPFISYSLAGIFVVIGLVLTGISFYANLLQKEH